MAFSWNNAAVAKLKELYEQGFSSSEIARRLSDLGRWSRNAVIGKIHRLGLHAVERPFTFKTENPPADHRAKPKTPRSRAKPGYCGFPEREPAYLPPEPGEPDTMARCTILQLTDKRCHFPIGDPREPGFCFCGNAIAGDGMVYCGYHMKIAHIPRAQRTQTKELPYYGTKI